MMFARNKIHVKTEPSVPTLSTILNVNALLDGLEQIVRKRIIAMVILKRYVRREALALTLMEDLFVSFFFIKYFREVHLFLSCTTTLIRFLAAKKYCLIKFILKCSF